MIDAIWNKIEGEFRAAEVARKGEILRTIEKSAYFQPAHTVKLLRLAVADPNCRDLPIIPRLLRNVAYNIEFTRECCAILWELGRDDQRSTNSWTDHPIRVLLEIAEYDLHKPVDLHLRVLDAVEPWVLDPREHLHAHSPLDILDRLLVRSGIHHEVDGLGLTMRPFGVDRDATAAIRDRAIELIDRAIDLRELRIAVRAVRSAAKLLYGVPTPLNLQLPEEFYKQWDREHVAALAVLRHASSSLTSDVLALAILDGVRPLLHHAIDPTLRSGLADLLASLPVSSSFALKRELRPQMFWDEMDDLEDERDSEAKEKGKRWEIARGKLEERRRQVADRFVSEHSRVEQAAEVVLSALAELREQGMQAQPNAFFWAVGERDPVLAAGLVKTGLARLDDDLIAAIPALLIHVRRARPDEAEAILSDASRSRDGRVRQAVATFLSSLPAAALGEEDIALLRQLIEDPDEDVRYASVWSLRQLAEGRPATALKLAISMPFGANDQIARELFMVLGGGQNEDSTLATASDEEIRSLLRKLVDVPSIEDHFIGEFISLAAKRVPRATIEMLRQRIHKSETREFDDYRPLPYGKHPNLGGLATNDGYVDLLREVRDSFLEADVMHRWWLKRLFARMTCEFTLEQGWDVLNEWIESRDAAKVADAAALFDEAPRTRVFERVQWAVNLIRTAAAVSEECLRRVQSYLFAAVVSEGKTGTPGQPFPQDVELKGQATSVSETLEPGSPEKEFFEDLVRYAEREIKRAIAEGELLDDE